MNKKSSGSLRTSVSNSLSKQLCSKLSWIPFLRSLTCTLAFISCQPRVSWPLFLQFFTFTSWPSVPLPSLTGGREFPGLFFTSFFTFPSRPSVPLPSLTGGRQFPGLFISSFLPFPLGLQSPCLH